MFSTPIQYPIYLEFSYISVLSVTGSVVVGGGVGAASLLVVAACTLPVQLPVPVCASACTVAPQLVCTRCTKKNTHVTFQGRIVNVSELAATISIATPADMHNADVKHFERAAELIHDLGGLSVERFS